MVKFLKWLPGAVRKGGVDEISAADQLRAFRAEGEGYQDDSFGTISGYAAHGAIIHYSQSDETPLEPGQLFLIDSGAHIAGVELRLRHRRHPRRR